MYDEIIEFLQRLSLIWERRRWNREARRALRACDFYRADIAITQLNKLYMKQEEAS